jgi:3-methyladenine DNA glycosylase AlkD
VGAVGVGEVDEVLARLRALENPEGRDGMRRFGIDVGNALGIGLTDLRKLGRDLPRDHRLAASLWDSGIHEARILAPIVDRPERVSRTQMERWARDFDAWDLCDQVCQNLFWATPFAHQKAVAWSERRAEFVKRAAFALMASAAVKDRDDSSRRFLDYLPIIEREAADERNFVRKAVSWALRQIGKRDPRLHRAALASARRLADRPEGAARWVGRDAIRELEGEAVRRKVWIG